MAEVLLDKIWFHDYTNFSVYRSFKLSGISSNRTVEGYTLKMANGRFVSVQSPGVYETWTINLRYVPRTDIAWLRSYIGKPLMIRTPHGELFFGQYYSLDMSEELLPGDSPNTVIGAVSLSVELNSLSEAV